MGRTKFQIGDKVQFKTSNSLVGYSKGRKGEVINVDTGFCDGIASYLVRFKHIVTGKYIQHWFSSRQLDYVKTHDQELAEENVRRIIQEQIKVPAEEKQPSIQKQTEFFNENTGWDDFCNSFKGELFKD